MATVRLSDAVVPTVFSRYMSKDTYDRSAIFNSGIMRQDPSLGGFLAGGGLTINMPLWLDLDSTAAGIANDDPASIATPGKIGTATQIAIRNIRTRGWSSADLVAELAGSDPMARIRERVSAWWTRSFEKTLVSELIGVFANNAANNAGDMTLNIALTSGTPLTANMMTASSLLEGKQTMGDNAEGLGVLIVHSRVYTNLQVQNLIAFIPNSEGHVTFPTYLGYRVVVSDLVPVTGSGPYVYNSYLLGAGSFAWAEAPTDTPVEIFRNPEQGNGMGVETMWTRRQFILHPAGHKWNDASRAGNFPTDAEYQAAGNWTRIFPERKQVPMVCIKTNG